MSVAHFGHIGYFKRYSVACFDYYVTQVVEAASKTIAANKITSTCFFNVGPTGHIVVFLNSKKQIVDAYSVGCQ